jgi:hypothetical protein
MGPLTKTIMNEAFAALDRRLAKLIPPKKISLIVGGGGAMILAHRFPKGTMDVDAIPRDGNADELAPLVREVAKELSLEPDWLNPYFSTFSHTLPPDYSERLIRVYDGKFLIAEALGKEDMLIMKCFAHRAKDIPHARALIREKANLDLVEKRLAQLLQKKIPGTESAMKFLQEVLDLEDGQ